MSNSNSDKKENNSFFSGGAKTNAVCIIKTCDESERLGKRKTNTQIQGMEDMK